MPRKPKGHLPSSDVRVPVTADLVAGFTETFLQEDFDNPKQSPPFHRKMWELFCSQAPYAVVAAPRAHAKSTAGTLSFGLACALFGSDDFILIVSATEGLAAAHLANMARVMQENEDLQTEFDVKIIQSNETKLVCRIGSREFCIQGRGAEQKVRGILWRNKRPSLIIIDDLEDDEAVMSKDRRDKLRNWVQNALIPCGSDRLRVRMVGTVLHLDALIERYLSDKDSQWVGLRFRAHKSYDDFSEILWPEQFPEARLRFIRGGYADNPSGYSQEYLNEPIAEADAFFRRSDFYPMKESDHASPKTFYASIDFALGKQEGDNTAICIAGVDPDGLLHIVDMVAEKMDTLQAVEKMFELTHMYGIYEWIVEEENIARAIGPFLNQEMNRRGEYLNLVRLRPSREKQQRAVSIKARMRAKGVRFNADAEWYPNLKGEMLTFPRGKADDRVDALAWIGLHLDKFLPSATRAELDEMAWREEYEESGGGEDGRSAVTGY